MLLWFWAMETKLLRNTIFVNNDGLNRRLSVVQFCDGAVVGLVAITPAAGYVPVWSAGPIGVIASAVIAFLKSVISQRLMRNDPLFIFLIHAGGGFIGMFLTGCFARDYVVGYDGYSSIENRSVAARLSAQMADAFMGFGYTLGMTMAILTTMKIVQRLLLGAKAWTLIGDDKTDKLEAELEYKWRVE